MLIDSHAHLDFDVISKNIKKILNNALDNKISSILSINTKINNFNNLYKLIKNYKSIWCSIGEHPCNINENNIPTKEIILSNINEKVIGIGETGIDLYRSKEFINFQMESFQNHIDASVESKLPLIIHMRNSENELINFLINQKKQLKVVMHCFSGSYNYLKKCLDNDYYISLSGIITFKNSALLQNMIHNIPINRLLIETDSPYLSPTPKRGKINEPSNLIYTASHIASILNINFDKLAEITTQNFYNLFTKATKYERIFYED